jgi:hypothetical protein
MIRSTRRFVGSRHRRARVVGGLLAVAVWTACGDRTEAGESGAGSASDGAVRSSGTDTALARLASELLPGVEQSSRIRAARPPALASSSRESLEGFLSRALVEQLPDEKAEAVAAVYARLGLLPDTLQLGPLFRSLLLEQVVGYYDPRRDTLYVVEGVSEDQLQPILVHELVHALQDQRIDLDSLTRSVGELNDRATAAQAALEGHATYVMMEWLISRQTGAPVDLTAMPDLGGLLGSLDPSLLAGTPVMRDAPRIVRESLIFPYIGGLVFLQRVWSADPTRPLPLGNDLPESTEQVLHPDRFLGERDHPSDVAFMEDPPTTWHEIQSDGLGELETRIFLEEHLGDPDTAASAAEGWDGDRYRLLRDEGREVLIWASVWDSERDAVEFEEAVGRAFDERYADDAGARVVGVERRQVEGRPVVLVVDAPEGLDPSSLETALRFEVRGG